MIEYPEVLTIRLTHDERSALDQIAKFDRSSRGAVMRRFLAEAIRTELPAILATIQEPKNSIH